jgi:peptide chain release factor 3
MADRHGRRFPGRLQPQADRIERFDASKGDHGASMVKVKVASLDDPGLASIIGSSYQERLMSDNELFDIAGDDLDMQRILAGELTRSFSAAPCQFRLEAFLNEFWPCPPPPAPRKSNEARSSRRGFFQRFRFQDPGQHEPGASRPDGFFALLGQVRKGMEVNHARLGKTVRLTQPQQFMAQERNIIEEAYAGDIIGIFDPAFSRSATRCQMAAVRSLRGHPGLPARAFRPGSPADSMKRKQFLRGVEQLAEEGAIQLYKEPDIGTETYIVGVVGILQLEVLEYRLKAEYGVSIRQTPLNFRHARWIQPIQGVWPDPRELNVTSTTQVALDKDDLPVLLFESDWAIQWAIDRNKGLQLASIHERQSL